MKLEYLQKMSSNITAAKIIKKLKKHKFLFEELVKRDFKIKYKRTVLGMGWSVLSPLLTLLVLNFVFSHYFGRNISHFTIYLFCGVLLFNFFKEATNAGMSSLMSNAKIFSKINAPKYIFLLARNVTSVINFIITLCVFLVFVLLEPNLSIHWKYIFLLFPICCMIIFNIGTGMVLSSMNVFFRDTSYLYSILTMLIMYMSAIFYSVDIVPENYKIVFLLNPVFCYISYFRCVVLDSAIPSISLHLLCMFYALVMLLLGAMMYWRYRYKFLYYI